MGKSNVVIRQWLSNKERFASFVNGALFQGPVITIVFYYGEESWDGQKDLHGLLGIEREEYKMLRKFIPNYGINLIDPKEIEDLKCFRKDLQMVFGMLQYRKDKTDLINYVKSHEDFFANVDIETGNAVKVLLGSEKLMQNIEKNESGGMNMCQALDELYQDGVNQGFEQGVKALIETCRELGMSREDTFTKVREKCTVSKETTEDYLMKYWN